MRNKIMIALLGFFMAVGAYSLSMHVEIEGITNAIAETDTSAISAACTDPTAAAFQGQGDLTVTWAAPARGSASTPSATMALANAVHSESNPSVTATLNASGVGGASSGRVSLVYQTPIGKIAGLQCQTLSQAKVQVHGDGSDNTAMDISVSNVADSDTNYTAADKVDDAASSSKDTLFGASGQISTSNVSDGSDQDSATNGEVVYGGTTESEGATQTGISLDISNYNVTAGTDVETLTITATAS